MDVLHSGTVSAAREAALYGLPSLSVSLATYSHQDYSESIDATLRLVERISDVVVERPSNLLRPEVRPGKASTRNQSDRGSYKGTYS